VRLVADANVLLSAVIGGRAALALRHNAVEQVFTPAAAFDEVFEYLPSVAKKMRLELDTLLLACAALPVTVMMIGVRRQAFDGQASNRQRDPDASMCSPSRSP
jgi:hypothetical protein